MDSDWLQMFYCSSSTKRQSESVHTLQVNCSLTFILRTKSVWNDIRVNFKRANIHLCCISFMSFLILLIFFFFTFSLFICVQFFIYICNIHLLNLFFMLYYRLLFNFMLCRLHKLKIKGCLNLKVFSITGRCCVAVILHFFYSAKVKRKNPFTSNWG